MRIKLTPLNLVAGVAVLASILLITGQFSFIPIRVSGMKVLFLVLFMVTAVVAFVSDLLFRKMVPSLKRLWIIELSLITLTVLFIILLKSLIG